LSIRQNDKKIKEAKENWSEKQCFYALKTPEKLQILGF